MSLDLENPAVPADESLEQWRTKTATAMETQAVEIKRANDLLAASTGVVTTEGALFLRILCAVLMGRLATSSSDAQVWAADLTKDYLVKYDLEGKPRTAS